MINVALPIYGAGKVHNPLGKMTWTEMRKQKWSISEDMKRCSTSLESGKCKIGQWWANLKLAELEQTDETQYWRECSKNRV